MKPSSAVLLLGAVAFFVSALPHSVGPRLKPAAASRATTNDNRRPAGTLRDGKLELKLDVVNAQWFPEAEDGPSVVMQTFAEQGRSPEIPGPMIPVPEGTEIHITLRNSLPNLELLMHEQHTRPATTDDRL